MKASDFQISLFDIINEARRYEAIPAFKKGQDIFIVSLDVVLEGTVGYSWICGQGEENPYFGYSIDYAGGTHTTVWDYSIGKTVFDCKEKAENAAAAIVPLISKITPNEVIAHDVRSFGYLRDFDKYKLTAIVAKVGETQLYEKGFTCYHFLRTYKTKAARDKEYKTALNKAVSESDANRGVELEIPPYEDLYRVTKDLFASRVYALEHGEEYAALRRRA